MSTDYKSITKALSMRFVTKAVKTFDQATVIVVSVCWGAAVLMMIFAIYALILSASTRRASETASAAEPILPKIVRKGIDVHDARPLVDRLQHRYPDISITLNNDLSVTIAADSGTKFREWLTAISYIDVMSPQYRWTIKEFCAGKCMGGILMHALLIGEKVSFEAPSAKDQSKDKH
jgi:hypothetical protein